MLYNTVGVIFYLEHQRANILSGLSTLMLSSVASSLFGIVLSTFAVIEFCNLGLVEPSANSNTSHLVSQAQPLLVCIGIATFAICSLVIASLALLVYNLRSELSHRALYFDEEQLDGRMSFPFSTGLGARSRNRLF